MPPPPPPWRSSRRAACPSKGQAQTARCPWPVPALSDPCWTSPSGVPGDPARPPARRTSAARRTGHRRTAAKRRRLLASPCAASTSTTPPATPATPAPAHFPTYSPAPRPHLQHSTAPRPHLQHSTAPHTCNPTYRTPPHTTTQGGGCLSDYCEERAAPACPSTTPSHFRSTEPRVRPQHGLLFWRCPAKQKLPCPCPHFPHPLGSTPCWHCPMHNPAIYLPCALLSRAACFCSVSCSTCSPPTYLPLLPLALPPVYPAAPAHLPTPTTFVTQRLSSNNVAWQCLQGDGSAAWERHGPTVTAETAALPAPAARTQHSAPASDWRRSTSTCIQMPPQPHTHTNHLRVQLTALAAAGTATGSGACTCDWAVGVAGGRPSCPVTSYGRFVRFSMSGRLGRHGGLI